MATAKTNAIIDPTSDNALTRQSIELALANGGYYAYQSDGNVYITEVTENVTNQTVYPSYNTVTNQPAPLQGGIQYNNNGNFTASENLTFNNQVLSTNTIATYAILTDNIKYANGVNWNFGEANYGNSNVANFLPNYTGDFQANNANFTGVLNLGDIANVNILGGNQGEAIVTSGTGNLAFVPVAYAGNLSNGNSSVFVVDSANINFTVSNANVGNFNTNGLLITGNLGISGNISATSVNAALVVGNSNIVLTNNFANIVANTTLAISASANGTNVTGNLSATGNITGANLVGIHANGNSNISIAGNSNVTITSGGNTLLTITPTAIVANANIVAGNLIGTLANGNSSVSIPASNGNVSITAVGNNVVTVTGTGANINGTANITGNLTVGGNLTISGSLNTNLASGTSNIRLSPSGNVTISSGGTSNVFTVTNSNTTTAGNQVVSGGASIGNSLIIGANTANSGIILTGASNGNVSNTSTISIYPGTGIVANYSLLLPNNVASSNGLVLGGNTDGTLYWTTGAIQNNIVNGNSNVFVSGNGNVRVSVAGNANILVVSGTGANITGTANISGNANVGNLGTTGFITATGNVSGGNLITGGVVNATGNISGANITGTGNITGANLNTGGNITANGAIAASANVSGGNLISSNNVVGTNITANANLTTANLVATTAANVVKLTANGNVSFTGANVSLGAVGNLKITGGSNNQVLTTDGTGNLIWTGGGGGAGSTIANGSSNVYVYLDGNISMGVANTGNSANTDTIVVVSGAGANILGALDVTGDVTLSNLSANSTVNLSGNVVTTGPNISLGSNANLHITGGSSGQALVTDGSGGLSWATVSGGLITALTNGSSNLVVDSSANIRLSIAGTANQFVFSPSLLTANGGLSLNGSLNVNNNSASINGQYLYVGNASGGSLVLRNTATGATTSIIASGDISPSDGTGTLVGNWTVGYLLSAPNLTVGTGTANLSTATVVNLGNVNRINIGGGSANQFLLTDGAGNLSWADPANTVTFISNSTTNVRALSTSVNFGISSQPNVLVVSTTGLLVGGSSNINISGGSLTANNDVTANNLNATSEITGNNLSIGNIVATGNITSINANLGNAVVANFFTGTLRTNAQPNVTSLGNLTSLRVNGTSNLANIIVSSGNFITGTLSSNANSQPNITTVGTLGNLLVSGNLGANGDINFGSANRVTLTTAADLIIGGGTNGQFLQQLGGGQVQWADVLVSNNAPGTSSDTGTAGQLAYASGFLYVCVGANSWKRVAISTF